jgi:hypothetical protein
MKTTQRPTNLLRLAAAVLAAVVSPARAAAPVSITNPGFENPAVPTGGGTASSPAGWSSFSSGVVLVLNPSSATANSTYNAGRHAGLVGKALEIRLLGKGLSSGREIAFDDVKLTLHLPDPVADAGGPYTTTGDQSVSPANKHTNETKATSRRYLCSIELPSKCRIDANQQPSLGTW